MSMKPYLWTVAILGGGAVVFIFLQIACGVTAYCGVASW